MGYDIGPRIGMEGEAEFREKIRQINTDLKTLDTEMAAVTSAYDKNDKSVASLTSRNTVLTKEIETQKSKLDLLKQGLQDATTKYGTADKTTQGWQQQVNKATASLNEMERELKENNTAIDASNKKTEELGKKQGDAKENSLGLGEALNGLTSKLGITLPEGVRGSLDSVAKLDAGLLTAVGSSAALAAGAYKLFDAMQKVTEAQAAWADEVGTTSQKTNISQNNLQELAYAARMVHVDMDTVTGSMSKMVRSMDSARDGTGDAAKAFDTLKVSVRDASTGQLRSAEAVFFDTIDALKNVSNATERDALSMTIFGKSAQELNPLIKAGSEGIKNYAEEAHKMGIIISDQVLASLQGYDDALDKADEAGKGFQKNLAGNMAPALTGLTDGFTNFSVSLNGFSLIGHVFDPLLQAITNVMNAFSALNNVVGSVFDSGNSTQYGSNLNDIWDSMQKNSFMTGLDSARLWLGNDTADAALQKYYAMYGHNASGTDYWTGGPTWVGERGPELIIPPIGTQIFSAQESADMASRLTAALQLMNVGGTSYSNSMSTASYGGGPIYVSIDPRNVKEFNDIVKAARTAQQTSRAKG